MFGTGRTARVVISGASVLGLLAGVTGALGGSTAAYAAPRSTSTLETGHIGQAYGTTVSLGHLVESGATALTVVGCTSSDGIDRTNSTVGVTLPGLTVGAISSSVSTGRVGGQPATTSSASVANVNIGNGAIEVTAITASSQTVASASGTTATGSSVLLGLTIGGQSYAATPRRNTKIAIPGIGLLILNRQRTTAQGVLTVDAIDLSVTVANDLGLPLGLHVVIGAAESGLTMPTAGVLSGRGYGTRLTVPGLAKSGPTAVALVGCLGTDGQTITNTTAGISTPLISTGTVTSTAFGSVTSTVATDTTTDTTQTVALLPGLLGPVLSVHAVTASATATRTGGVTTLSDAGSSFLDLSVDGVSYPADVPANTVINLAVAKIYLHRVITSATRIDVRMIELVLNVPLDGMAAGTDLVIAGASVRVN